MFSPHSGPINAPHEESTSSASSNDQLHQQYKSIKDSVQKIRLPPGLKVETSLRGVGQQFNKTARGIHAAADYSETLLKLLLAIDTSNDPIVISDDLVDCLVIAVTAQVRYLQSEKSVCFVSGRFGEDVGNLFREFKVVWCNRAKKLKWFVSSLNDVYWLVIATCKTIDLKVNSIFHKKHIHPP